MTKNNDIVFNINDPIHIETRCYDGGFEVEIIGSIKGTFRRKIVKIKFERWWVQYIARIVNQVLTFESDELKRIKNCVAVRLGNSVEVSHDD